MYLFVSPKISRSSHRCCYMKKVFLKVLQNSQENSSKGLRFATFIKQRLWFRGFLVHFAKFLRVPFFIEHLRTTASELLSLWPKWLAKQYLIKIILWRYIIIWFALHRFSLINCSFYRRKKHQKFQLQLQTQHCCFILLKRLR